MTSWCYWTPEEGPQMWPKYFPSATGTRQSPIDITKDICTFDPKLKNTHFRFNYHPYDCDSFYNKGVTWAIKIKEDCVSTLSADHLHGDFRLFDVHAHWGVDRTCGAEHLIAGEAYAAEIHIVHMNKKYETVDEAVKHPDGLAVLGILVEESENDNDALEPLVENINQITYKDDIVKLRRGFNVKQLLPQNKDFWTYEGSLTSPPCSECVLWTVFRTPVPASLRQLSSFRQIFACDKEEKNGLRRNIVNNFRHIQPLNDRFVKSSFEF